MVKVLAESWSKNQNKLKEYLTSHFESLNHYSYEDIVRITFHNIYEGEDKLNVDKLTEIDDGDYQGTLLFVIPFQTYQPGPGEYLMTYVSYGSCSGCDTLQSLYYCNDTNEKINGFMCLCKDILTNTIKPYNEGWRFSKQWEQIEWEGNF
jgi:hypothetical protein